VPRRPRLDAPGLVHHVFVRGIDRRDLFLDDPDRRAALDALARVLPEEGAGCLAWAVQSNHLHLVVRTGHRPLAHAMQRVGTAFGRYFNDRYGRSGYVFESRYGVRRVDDDEYLLTLIRYVHRNPIEAGSVASVDALAAWPWTGHAALVGRRPAEAFHAIEDVLELFGSSPARARAELCAFMASEAPAPPPGDARALDALIDAVCRELGVDRAAVCRGRRRRPESTARRVIALRARAELGVPHAVISQALGVSRQALWARLHGES
jgi:REP element-mobilizing transposase RayT